jgi:hypothetical protein
MPLWVVELGALRSASQLGTEEQVLHSCGLHYVRKV